MRHVAIVGGGIAGLAAAYYLQTRGRGAVNYTLVESAPRLGGKIVSARENGFVVEGGPDSFLTTKPAALELCRELLLGDDLIGTNDAGRKVYVWSRGQLRAMPDGVMLIIPTRLTPFVTSSLISPLGKLRMGLEALIPPRREDEDESLSHFVTRRLGAEALDRIAEPMIAGIYVAEAENLSLQSTFPRFLDMEKKYGGLLRGVVAQKIAARRNGQVNGNGNGNGNGKPTVSMFMTLRGGLQQIVESLVERLPGETLLTNRVVINVRREGRGFVLALSDGAQLQADEIVFATPAYVTARLVRSFEPELAEKLQAVQYVSTATVSLGYRRAEVTHPLNGFGFVVPRSENRKILACTWSSTKFDSRAPEGHVLLRVFIGGARAEQTVEQEDRALEQIAREELRAMMGLDATPVVSKVYRWTKANPQYQVGHQARIAEIDRLANRQGGLHLAGAAYHGVGIPDCIEDGKRAVERILQGYQEDMSA
ncbi:MAG TPA: protoporphyrinogen oxidase [Anaerolineae bacterium]